MDFIPIIIAICDKNSATGHEVALNMGTILEMADRADDDEQCNFPLRRLAEHQDQGIREPQTPESAHYLPRCFTDVSQASNLSVF